MRKKKTAKKCSDHVEIKMLNKLRQHKKKTCLSNHELCVRKVRKNCGKCWLKLAI